MTTIAKRFTHDGDQAVCLPEACCFECDEVRISRDGDKVIPGATKGANYRSWANLGQA